METERLNNLYQRFTVAILFILLMVRNVLSPLFAPDRQAPLWLTSLWLLGTYFFIVIVIWLNRENLQSININKYFIAIFIFTGIVLSIYWYTSVLGILVGISALFILYIARSGQLNLKDALPGYWNKTIVVLVWATLFCLLLVNYKITFCEVGSRTALYYVVILSSVVYEELIFRGLLWMFLKKMHLSERKVFYVQSFLFWIAHINYIENPFSFWLYVPMMSLILGILVWRSQSIFKSTIVHYVFNLFFYLIRDILCI
jgi:membrane protease YdiL (CAAX protease family)